MRRWTQACECDKPRSSHGNDNEFDVYDDAFDEFVMREEELLLAKFAEYRTIVDKSVGN